jgi:hypothetical protein
VFPLFFPLRALPLLDLIRPGSRLIVHPLESKLTGEICVAQCEAENGQIITYNPTSRQSYVDYFCGAVTHAHS